MNKSRYRSPDRADGVIDRKRFIRQLMDLISIFLSLFGFGVDRANKISVRRVEVARLNAEVAGEASRSLEILKFAIPRLRRRFTELCPDNPGIAESCINTLETMHTNYIQIREQTEGLREQIESTNSLADWDLLLRRMNEWRVTASHLCPEVEAVVKRFDEVLDSFSHEK